MQGVVKTYDPVTGIGIIVDDDGGEEFILRAGSLQGSLFRFLRQGQRVTFTTTTDDEGTYAINLGFGQDGF